MARQFYSKPVYRTLIPVDGRPHHCVMTDAQGVARATQLCAAIEGASECIVVCEPQAGELIPGAAHVTGDTLEDYLAARLRKLPVGTQFYLFGREQFVWPLQDLLRTAHVPLERCAVERCGPLSRDVFCVHCRQTTTDVAHTPIDCTGCGRRLHVYDHFSKRLGCYMGFQVNAECEEEIPPQEVLL